jgi:RHS repeat-associated protein
VFGSVSIFSPSDEPRATSDVGNAYLFTGREYDSETGNYYYRARYYSPKIGRFLQTDPVGYVGGINLYAYCGNNPINRVDPSGLYDAIRHGRECEPIGYEPELPFNIIPYDKFKLHNPCDFIFLSQSPGYTSKKTDAFIDIISEYIKLY